MTIRSWRGNPPVNRTNATRVARPDRLIDTRRSATLASFLKSDCGDPEDSREVKTGRRKSPMTHGGRIFATSSRRGYIFYWQPAKTRKTFHEPFSPPDQT